MENTFLLTRPRLANLLTERGITATPCSNPFHPGRTAWLLQLTPENARFIKNWYEAEGAKVPDKITKYLNERG